MRVVSQYEVSCPSCKVSYPVGQKRCVHCGGPTAPSIVNMPDTPPQLSFGTRSQASGPVQLGEDEGEMIFMPAGRDDDDDGPAGGSALSRIGGLVWIVIFVVITVIRACFGE